jgi:hypothetical protein
MSIKCSRSSDDTSGVNQDQASLDRQLPDDLVKRWQSEPVHVLELRHETGAWLNNWLGAPTVRLAHGQQVLKRVGEVLGTSESELSRMRWLPYHFPDRANLQRGKLKLVSWTHFKRVLPRLRTPEGLETRQYSLDVSRDVVETFAGSLRKMASRLRGQDNWPGDADRGLILEGLRELAEAVSSRLGIPVRMIVDPEVPTPDPNNGHAEHRPSASDDGDRVVAITPGVPS